MNLLDVYKELNTEAKCLAFLEAMRWPNGVKCLACNCSNITAITAKGKRNKKTGKVGPDRHLYQCNDCRFQFTATTGTVYHDTHLPLHKWFLAIALITESKKGISANQLQIRWLVPLHGEAILEILRDSRHTIIVENNYSGQFARYLRSETSFVPDGHIRKYDGEPFMPHHIVEAVKEQLAGKTKLSVPMHEIMV